jgi:hypothetical protein
LVVLNQIGGLWGNLEFHNFSKQNRFEKKKNTKKYQKIPFDNIFPVQFLLYKLLHDDGFDLICHQVNLCNIKLPSI